MLTLKESYTYRGKEHTATVSHYCPSCRKAMTVTPELLRVLQTVTRESERMICCSEVCRKVYREQWGKVEIQIVKATRTQSRGYFLVRFDELQEQAMTDILNAEKSTAKN